MQWKLYYDTSSNRYTSVRFSEAKPHQIKSGHRHRHNVRTASCCMAQIASHEQGIESVMTRYHTFKIPSMAFVPITYSSTTILVGAYTTYLACSLLFPFPSHVVNTKPRWRWCNFSVLTVTMFVITRKITPVAPSGRIMFMMLSRVE